jgi:uncharacterized protein (TIGR01244 family)
MFLKHVTTAFTLVVAVAALGPAAAGQVVKKEVPGITNFSRVDATIACGGATTPAAVQALKAEGFTSIVNLRAADEPGANVEAEGEAARAAGVQYFHMPFKGAADAAVVDRFLEVVSAPKNQPVFIHCATANRVAALWLIKRVRLDGWAVEKALTEAGAIGLTNPTLRQFALDYLSRDKKSGK